MSYNIISKGRLEWDLRTVRFAAHLGYKSLLRIWPPEWSTWCLFTDNTQIIVWIYYNLTFSFQDKLFQTWISAWLWRVVLEFVCFGIRWHSCIREDCQTTFTHLIQVTLSPITLYQKTSKNSPDDHGELHIQHLCFCSPGRAVSSSAWGGDCWNMEMWKRCFLWRKRCLAMICCHCV